MYCLIAWGIVTLHPFAVRALEKITGFACNVKLNAHHAESLVEAAGIPYADASRLCITESKCVIDPEYFI
jgi:hypothetical protein